MGFATHGFMRRVLILAVGVLIGQWLAFAALTPPTDFHALGLHAFERRDYAEAARVWSRAVSLHPDNPLFQGLVGLTGPVADAEPGVVTVSLQAMRGVWLAPVVLNEIHRARFLVDSGSSVTLVSPALAATLGLVVGPGEGRRIELQTLAGRTTGASTSVRSLRLGGAEHRDAPVIVHDPGPGIDGILGNDFLGRYLLTLDGARAVLHLRPQPRN
ncbi:MAG: retropepsin-like aspartic protease family protein [Candidatus Rokuibacteriota bacterium]